MSSPNPYYGYKQIPDPLTRAKRDVMMSALTVIVFTVVFYTLQTIVMVVQIIVGGGIQSITETVLSGGAAGEIDMEQILDMSSKLTGNIPGGVGLTMIVSEALTLPVLLMLRQKHVPRPERRAPALPGAAAVPMLFVIATGAQLVFIVISTLLDALLSGIGLSSSDYMDQSIELLKHPAGYVYIVFAGPIMEEIIFRGAVLRRLLPSGENFAIVASAMLFGMYHLIFVQGLFAFLVGIVLGYTAVRYSIYHAMIIHIAVNSLSMALDFIVPDDSGQLIIMIALFAFALVLLILLRSKIREQKTFGRIAAPGIWRAGLGHPLMIFCYAFFLMTGVVLMLL